MRYQNMVKPVPGSGAGTPVYLIFPDRRNPLIPVPEHGHCQERRAVLS